MSAYLRTYLTHFRNRAKLITFLRIQSLSRPTQTRSHPFFIFNSKKNHSIVWCKVTKKVILQFILGYFLNLGDTFKPLKSIFRQHKICKQIWAMRKRKKTFDLVIRNFQRFACDLCNLICFDGRPKKVNDSFPAKSKSSCLTYEERKQYIAAK